MLVTHDRHEAAALADETALLVAGRIRQHGPTSEVLDRPVDPDCARLLGYTNQLPPAVTGRDELLVARPERCRPVHGPPGLDELGVGGVVRRVVPLGAGTRVDVDTLAGALACYTDAASAGGPAPDGARPGDPITVVVAEADTRQCSGTVKPRVFLPSSRQQFGAFPGRSSPRTRRSCDHSIG